MFILNKSIVHLDLSFNGFRKLELLVMNEGLKENHSIMGLHLLGNEVLPDSLGFVSASEEGSSVNDVSSAHVMTRISSTLDMGRLTKNQLKLHSSSNCWICEGWT